MAFEAILNEVEQLHSVSNRLEDLAELHPPMCDALLRIAGNVRGTATLLAVAKEYAAPAVPAKRKPVL